ncbi:MAG: phenylalanine--tRNA ligase subunit beta [Chloroflexi bacterium]|nr:phenylalanine--tRNA ligase subunit beta [Chloroflexota bacterium]
MKVPLSWLKAYVDIEDDPREVARRLTLAGIEADSVTFIGEGWDKIVVGQVTAVAPHPNADRLRLATVDTGEGKETVVCGAPNVAAGQKIAFAGLGARLIDAHSGESSALKAAKIRGVESRGMVCSERELGISDEHEGILVLPDDATVGAPLSDVLGDVVFEFSVTPNRPDCLSVLGIAREVGALTGRKVREPALDYTEAGEPVERLARVEIRDPDLCPRYIATVVTGVTIGPSPRWMQDRLNAAGMRPINNIVDVTNYVMLEYGQPLHAFDLDTLAERRIVVRRAGDGESMTTIDGLQRSLTPDMLVIADAERPVALAGVMGGFDSEVGDGTTSVLLEAACFDGVNNRSTSRVVGLRSEASLRFEKGLSPDLPLPAARRATQLMVELAGGVAAEGVVDVYPGRRARKPVRITLERTQRLLGVEVSMAEMARVLESLGFEVERGGGDALEVVVPYWRTDIAIEDDLIEEVVRIKGYDWVPTSTRAGDLPAYEPAPMLALKDTVREAMVSSGLIEVVTYSLTNKDVRDKAEAGGPEPMRLANPLSSELEELRTSLRGGLLQTLEANQRGQQGGIRLFEVGRVFLPKADSLPDEREVLAAVLTGPRRDSFWQSEDGELGFFDGKGVLEALFAGLGLSADYRPATDSLLHPGRTASVTLADQAIGLLGELHPRALKAFDLFNRTVAYFELDLTALLALAPDKARAYEPVPRYPGLVRDLALVVDASISAETVRGIIQSTPLVREASLFDVYTGDQLPTGKKSLAYRIVYQSPGRTLTNEEAERTQERLLQRLQQELGATLRS